MMFEYDPYRLIKEVHKRPGIWDLKCLDHRYRKKRSKLWGEVVDELNSNIVNATKSERRELEFQLQKKWKGLRDSFFKYVNNPNRTKRPYIYLKKLQFLIGESNPDLACKKEDDSSSDPEDDKPRWRKKGVISLKDDTSEDDINTVDDEDTFEIEGDNNDDYEVHAEPEKPPINKPAQNTFAFAHVEAGPSENKDADDSDRLFLLSLLSHLKSIPESNKLAVKMDLMQVLQNAKFSYDSTIDHKHLNLR